MTTTTAAAVAKQDDCMMTLTTTLASMKTTTSTTTKIHIFVCVFTSAVMDGIDLDIEGGRGDNYGDFIKEMRRLMDDDQSKVYILTGAPQCPYPDHYLGPGGQSGMVE